MMTRTVPQVPDVPPSTFAALAKDALAKVAKIWTDSRSHLQAGQSVATSTHEAQVRAAIALLDRALARLGNRSGERAADARLHLEAQRSSLAAKLNAFESLGFDGRRDFDGDPATEIIERVASAHADFAQAERAVDVCDDIGRLAALQQARDVARVERNASVSALRALCRSAKCPDVGNLPRAEDYNAAEQNTRDLTGAGPMQNMLRALQQGAQASPTIARLWCIYEANETATVKARWQMYEEAHPAPTAVAAE